MEITVTGRHTDVPDRFRRHIEEKLAKVPQVQPRVTRCDVVVTHESNPRQAKESERVEITCRGRRMVIRAEASADDEYGALDVATGRLLERLRRASDKKRVHHGRHEPVSVAKAMSGLEPVGLDGADAPEQEPISSSAQKVGGDVDCPVTLREKVHVSHPMSIDEALGHMEAVGHDFFLFHDKEKDSPSVVYRRRGWSYGVITLDVQPWTEESDSSRDTSSEQESATA